MMNIIYELANNKIKNKESNLKIKLEINSDRSVRLRWISNSKDEEFENMFGRLVYSETLQTHLNF